MPNLRARSLRVAATNAEKHLWKFLRGLKAPGIHFRRQGPIGAFIVDFCCHAAKLIVEIDGGQHNTDEALKRDAVRTAWLKQRGYRVLRFWNNDVLGNAPGVVEHIQSALKHTPTPTPPRKGEGLSG
jgi:very-short-patch-repair endonuclease